MREPSHASRAAPHARITAMIALILSVSSLRCASEGPRISLPPDSGATSAPPSDTTPTASAPSYTTTFAQTETPLSEGGVWHHVDPLLTVVASVDGHAFGTQTGTSGYDDSNAYVTGFGTNYEVAGIIWLNPAWAGNGNREVEILLRWSDDGPLRPTSYGDTHANGYEINVQHAGHYMQLGRFKAGLLEQVDAYASPRTGDRFRARIEGQRIRVWWNETLMIDYTDADAARAVTTGDPGIGFYVSGGAPNTDFGFDAVTITALP